MPRKSLILNKKIRQPPPQLLKTGQTIGPVIGSRPPAASVARSRRERESALGESRPHYGIAALQGVPAFEVDQRQIVIDGSGPGAAVRW